MTKLFYLSEIIKFAVEKEIESEKLYQQLSEQTNDLTLKALFEKLVGEEKKHETFYANMLSHVQEKQSPGVKEDNEYNAYMQELITSSRSTLPLSAAELSDMNAAIDYAINREKDSILFYVGLKNLVPSHAQDKIDIIIKEEAKHIVMLSGLK